MIERLTFKGFKGLADVQLPSADERTCLTPLTVLVGPNGSGKTSVLQAVERLCGLNAPTRHEQSHVTSRVGDVFCDEYSPANIRTRGLDAPIELTAKLDGGSRVAVRLEPATTDFPYGKFNIELFGPTGLEVSREFPGRDMNMGFWGEARLRALGRAAYFQLDPRELRAPSYSESTPELGERGELLPSVLANVASTDREMLERIESDLRAIVPACRRIRTPHAAVSKVKPQTVTINGQSSVTLQQFTYGGNRLELEIAGAGFLGADLLSEGTLIVLGLLTALHTSPGRSVFLLDDVERALHPSAQGALISALRRFLERHRGAQILCTSHSPYIIDHFAGEEVCVMGADESGHAYCRRLADHPEWLAWKGQLEPGEFWASVGESWARSA